MGLTRDARDLESKKKGGRSPFSVPLAASPRCADAGITFYDANGNTVVTQWSR